MTVRVPAPPMPHKLETSGRQIIMIMGKTEKVVRRITRQLQNVKVDIYPSAECPAIREWKVATATVTYRGRKCPASHCA